jgi:hypothetical protein
MTEISNRKMRIRGDRKVIFSCFRAADASRKDE